MKFLLLVLIALAAMSNAKISGFLKKMNKALNLPKNSEVLYDVEKIQELEDTIAKQEQTIEVLQSFHYLDQFNCEALGDKYVFILGKCYYMEETAMTYLDAANNCENRFGKFGSGQHFEPMDQLSNDNVIQVAREMVTTSHKFWLGIVDEKSTNEWTYQSNGNLAIWTSWGIGQPGNGNGNIEDCSVAYNPKDFNWHDIPCDKSHPSICEYVPKLFDCEGMGSSYIFLLGNCYYFEETSNNFDWAAKNCEDKFGAHGYGQLFEPKNKQMNDKVIQAARNIVETSSQSTTTNEYYTHYRDSKYYYTSNYPTNSPYTGPTHIPGGCNHGWIGDGYCDDINNNQECKFDGGDCCGPNVNTQYCTECLCLNSGYWLGIVDTSTTNKWYYHSNGNPLTWANWNVGSPNGNNGEDCSVVYNTDDFEWHDIDCDDSHLSICEFTMVPIPTA